MGWCICYPDSMKRYTTKDGLERSLCEAEDNTCQNLADYKEKRANGSRRYHRFCDKHRRPGHKSKRNANGKWYIPLDYCVLCGSTENLHRHRILRGTPYRPKNVLVFCKPCHDIVHKLEDLFQQKNHYIRRGRRGVSRRKKPLV